DAVALGYGATPDRRQQRNAVPRRTRAGPGTKWIPAHDQSPGPLRSASAFYRSRPPVENRAVGGGAVRVRGDRRSAEPAVRLERGLTVKAALEEGSIESFVPSAPPSGKPIELVFRTVGERTSDLALSLAIQHVQPTKVHVIRDVKPFALAVRR